jgi:membrane-bound lytic murein transglycosylase F
MRFLYTKNNISVVRIYIKLLTLQTNFPDHDKMRHNSFLFVVLAALLLQACGGKGNNAAPTAKDSSKTKYDLAEIEESGEIIATTLYGPTTYYDYNGKETGTAYDLLSAFAQNDGIGVRVEAVNDTSAMIKLLKSGEADIIITPLPTELIHKAGLEACAERNNNGQKTAWAVRKDQTDLYEALDGWYKPGIEKKTIDYEIQHNEAHEVKRHIHAPYVSRSKGIISYYDREFIAGSRIAGMDWRLIAAQCYQESGFDPNAVSWAGAKGLMQIIPSTAQHLGVNNVFDPKENIYAGCRYLRELSGHFSDVRNRMDRIKFTLAAYNGGARHIRDAMNLARKHGKSPTSYNDVSYYIRNLDKPQFYNDPVVKNGFLMGRETYNYVEQIMERWNKYRGGKAVSMLTDNVPLQIRGSQHRNRFTRGKTEIIDLRDSL